jgi:L-ascorbate metabolism protein UlaG (beta-lactamase superfamily)
MNIKQIRNATLLIEYAGTRFLVDPSSLEREPLQGSKEQPTVTCAILSST